MKANELRIGNLLWDDIFHYSVEEIGDILKCEIIDVHNYEKARSEDFYEAGLVYSLNYENVKPIPLTEEWLIKLGFKRPDNYPDRFDLELDDELIISIYSDWSWGIREDEDDISIGNGDYSLKEVHRIQNLCFALTGEELKLKEDK